MMELMETIESVEKIHSVERNLWRLCVPGEIKEPFIGIQTEYL